MQITAINQTTTLSPNAPVAKQAPQTQTPAETSRLAQDVVQNTQVKRGVVPTLKGAGAGLVGGAVAAGIPVGLLALAAKGSGEGAIVAFTLGAAAVVVGGTAGTLSGAVTANSTTSKGKGALIGAGVGAAAGAAALGLMSKGNVGSMVIGGVAGAFMGAAGGFAGSLVAKH